MPYKTFVEKSEIVEKLLDIMITSHKLAECAVFIIHETVDPRKMQLPQRVSIRLSRSGVNKSVTVVQLCKYPGKSDMSLFQWQPARFADMSVPQALRDLDFPGAWNTAMVPLVTMPMFSEWSTAVRAFKTPKAT